MSIETIQSEIKISFDDYYYKSKKFAEVYWFKKFKDYDNLSFFIKPNDKNYLIYAIYGTLFNDLNECLNMSNKIVKEFSTILKETKYKEFKEERKKKQVSLKEGLQNLKQNLEQEKEIA